MHLLFQLPVVPPLVKFVGPPGLLLEPFLLLAHSKILSSSIIHEDLQTLLLDRRDSVQHSSLCATPFHVKILANLEENPWKSVVVDPIVGFAIKKNLQRLLRVLRTDRRICGRIDMGEYHSLEIPLLCVKEGAGIVDKVTGEFRDTDVLSRRLIELVCMNALGKPREFDHVGLGGYCELLEGFLAGL